MTSPAERPTGVAAALGLYALARLGVVAVVAAVLVLAGVPLAVALLVGLVVALPLSMVLFRGLRARLDTALAETARRRALHRDALRSRLRGEEADPTDVTGTPAASGDRPQGQPDGSGG